jgi:hypothetical protein
MTAFLKITALAVSFLAHGVHSVDVAFVDGADCTGIGLYGTKDIPYLPCYDLSSFDPASSIHMRNMTRDQVLHFFSDSSCQVALHSTDNTDDQCFTSPIGRFGSFQVSSSDSSLTIHGRDSSTIDTTDVVPYAIKMSNYTDMGTFDPVKIDLGLSIFTLGLGLIGLGQAITLYGAINTCVALKGPNPSPKDIFDCAIQPVSTIVTIAGTALIHAAGKRVARRFQMAEGTVINLRKRAEMIDGLNADFVHSIMNTTVEGDDIVHIGSAERSKSRRMNSLEQDLTADDSFLLDMSTGMHSSPVYQVNFGDGGLWHFSSFYEHEHGDFVHHMRPASETELEKRSAPNPYNTIRWKSGGFGKS